MMLKKFNSQSLPLLIFLLLTNGFFLVNCSTYTSETWEEVFHEDFESPDALNNWVLDGHAEVSITEDGRLEIDNTQNYSVLWYNQPFWGDLKLTFDGRAEPGSRVLFFFNARADNPDKDIFAWERPEAAYGDYAYEPRLELYTMGLLRSDLDFLNLRHLGGDIPAEWMEVMPYLPQVHPDRYLTEAELQEALESTGRQSLPHDDEDAMRELTRQGKFPDLLAPHIERRNEVNASFQENSIIATHESETSVFADPDKSYHIEVTVIDNHVEIKVDGETIVDLIDIARQNDPLKGGYFAFRNFRATKAWYDNIRIYRKSSSE